MKTAYKVNIGVVRKKPYYLAFKHYRPLKPFSHNALVLIQGAGHSMKIWEETPSGDKGWAPLLAERDREVLILNWASSTSKKDLCVLTQKENIALIRQTINQTLGPKKKIILLGWSMGGPQAFKIATDFLPKRVVAILAYGASGPINSYSTKFKSPHQQTNLSQPLTISPISAKKIIQSPLFPKKWLPLYIKNYLVPFSPTMLAIQAQQEQVKNLWPTLILKHPKNLPPIFLLNGSLDSSNPPEKQRHLKNWIKKIQPDVTLKYLKNFPHTGMIVRKNKKPVEIYLQWLKKRGL